MAEFQGVSALLKAERERSEPWADAEVQRQYMDFLEAAEVAEHCIFARESRSSHLLAILMLIDAVAYNDEQRDNFFHGVGWRKNGEGNFELLRDDAEREAG
jgi:hypothetical protein